jgi:ribose 5-phosphate isomerase B
LIVAIGCDPPGFEHKLYLLKVLKQKGYDVIDVGCHSLDPADYPEYARIVGDGVASGEFDRGILFCGTGQGMNIAANKVKNVRAALCHEVLPAIMSRDHNDANVLCMGAWMIEKEQAERVALNWLRGRFSGGVHTKRIEMIKVMEAD